MKSNVEQQYVVSNVGYVILIALIAAIGGILFGFDTGVISGAILFLKTEFHLSSVMNGFVVSSVLIGATLGAAISGRVADYFGRRRLLIITSVVFLIGTLACAFAASISVLVVARIIVGIAIGIASFVVPLYISEVAPTKYRGGLISFNQLAITIGIVLAYVVDAHFSNSGQWRWMFAMGLIPALLLFIGSLFIPKSPRWLVLVGRMADAKTVLATVRDKTTVDLELEEIRESVEQKKTDWKTIFKKWVRPALVVSFGLAMFQQITGINTIIYYAPTIFEFAGFKSAHAAILATSSVGAVNVLMTLIALPFVDKWGRRPLLLCGLTGMAIALAVLGYAFLHSHVGDSLKWISLGSMLLYIACFAMSLGVMLWVIVVEVFPLEIRGFGSAIAVAFSWICNGVVSFTFLSFIDWLGRGGTFLMYAALCVLGLLFVYKMVPETKGVSLEKIEKHLKSGKKLVDLQQ